jgi:hypothetical protein
LIDSGSNRFSGPNIQRLSSNHQNFPHNSVTPDRLPSPHKLTDYGISPNRYLILQEGIQSSLKMTLWASPSFPIGMLHLVPTCLSVNSVTQDNGCLGTTGIATQAAVKISFKRGVQRQQVFEMWKATTRRTR